MHTDSSARRTCRLSRSASLNTATVAISSSRQARMTRSAISPRFATRTLRNMPLELAHPVGVAARPGLVRRAGLREGRARRLRGRALALHRGPGAVRGPRDALELEGQLVRVIAVLERRFLVDQPGLEQRQHR